MHESEQDYYLPKRHSAHHGQEWALWEASAEEDQRSLSERWSPVRKRWRILHVHWIKIWTSNRVFTCIKSSSFFSLLPLITGVIMLSLNINWCSLQEFSRWVIRESYCRDYVNLLIIKSLGVVKFLPAGSQVSKQYNSKPHRRYGLWGFLFFRPAKLFI